MPTVKPRPEVHMDTILFEVFLKSIDLIPQQQILQWHYLYYRKCHCTIWSCGIKWIFFINTSKRIMSICASRRGFTVVHILQQVIPSDCSCYMYIIFENDPQQRNGWICNRTAREKARLWNYPSEDYLQDRIINCIHEISSANSFWHHKNAWKILDFTTFQFRYKVLTQILLFSFSVFKGQAWCFKRIFFFKEDFFFFGSNVSLPENHWYHSLSLWSIISSYNGLISFLISLICLKALSIPLSLNLTLHTVPNYQWVFCIYVCLANHRK